MSRRGPKTKYGYQKAWYLGRTQRKISWLVYPTYTRFLQKEKDSIGIVWRRRGGEEGWHARIKTDPLIIGTGRTRDAAVDDARRQVGDG